MPVYTYHCENCGHEFDKQQSYSEQALTVCPQCRKHGLHRVYKPAGVVFRGSGFYVTDKRSSATSSSNGKSKTTATKSETKTESKNEAKSDSSKTNKSE